MRRLRRVAIDALLVCALAIAGMPFASTDGAFSSATSSPANRFANLEVAPATLDPASVTGGTVRLTWTASATAATETVTYGVMRRNGGGAYGQIASVSGLTYDDAPGDGAWEYVIRASVSAFSADSSAQGATIDGTPPAAASGVTAAAGTSNGTVTLTWTAGTDATSGVAGYTIRYVQANACPSASASAYPSSASVGAVTSTTVSGLTRNRTYCFYLITSDGAGNQSGPSNVASAKAK